MKSDGTALGWQPPTLMTRQELLRLLSMLERFQQECDDRDDWSAVRKTKIAVRDMANDRKDQ